MTNFCTGMYCPYLQLLPSFLEEDLLLAPDVEKTRISPQSYLRSSCSLQNIGIYKLKMSSLNWMDSIIKCESGCSGGGC